MVYREIRSVLGSWDPWDSRDLGKERPGVGGRVFGERREIGVWGDGLPATRTRGGLKGFSAMLAGIWAQTGVWCSRESLACALLSSGLCLRPGKVQVPTSDRAFHWLPLLPPRPPDLCPFC